MYQFNRSNICIGGGNLKTQSEPTFWKCQAKISTYVPF